MDIDDILNIKNVRINCELRSRKEALYSLSNFLLESKVISNRERFIDDILEREDRGSTFIGNYLAIPHGISDYVIKSEIAILKTEKPFNWDKNNSPVKLIVLFAINKDAEDEEIEVIKKFTSSLGDMKFIDNLLKANTKMELVELIRDYVKE